jgi:hypothetical protein
MTPNPFVPLCELVRCYILRIAAIHPPLLQALRTKGLIPSRTATAPDTRSQGSGSLLTGQGDGVQPP